MSKLQEIKDQVAREKYNTSWDALLYDMYPDDTYVNDALSRYEIDVMMEEVARRYAKSVAEDALKRAAERATVETYQYDKDGSKIFYQVLEQEVVEEYGNCYATNQESILSTPININL